MKNIFTLLLFGSTLSCWAQSYDSQCKSVEDGSLIFVDFKSPAKLVLSEDFFGVSDFKSKVTLKKAEISPRGKISYRYLGSNKELILSHDEEALKNFDPASAGFELEVRQMEDGKAYKPSKFLCRLYR